MNEDNLPPLPPPLPPTHSRSFSSSSSSSAGSPQPLSAEWARRLGSEGTTGNLSGERNLGIDDEEDEDWRRETLRNKSGSLYSKRSNRSDVSSAPSSPASLREPLPRSTTASAPPAPLERNTSSSPQPPANNHGRASAFLSQISPSLSAHSRYSSTPSTSLAHLGLRGSPEPLGLGIGVGGVNGKRGSNFNRSGGEQLPSPPQTVSDRDSNGGGSQFGTVRGTDMIGSENGIDSASSGGGGGDQSPAKPDRPPKSERRQSGSTSNNDKILPVIGRTSPTVAGGSSDNTPSRPSSSAARNRVRASDSFASMRRQSPSPSPRSNFSPSASQTSFDDRASEDMARTNSSESVEELRDSLIGVEPRRRLRARTASSGADQTINVDGAEERRMRQSQRASELKEKNQRILDTINSNLLPLVSPTSSDRAPSPSPPSQSRPGIPRSSTSSTIRDLADGDGHLPNASAHERDTNDEQYAPRRSNIDLEEFGVGPVDGMRRSATLGDVSDQRDFDRDTRARTAGYRSNRPRTSLLRRALDDDQLPERSMTSMSNYPSTVERIRARRSEVVGSERTRAASSVGDTSSRDQDFSEGMRRLASRELLRTPRDRSHSQSDVLGTSNVSKNTSPPSIRNRPGLPTEFLRSPIDSSSSIHSSRITPRRSIDTSSTSRLTPSASTSSSQDLSRLAQPRSSASQLTSPVSATSSSQSSPQERRRQSRSEVSFDDDYSRQDEDDERERTPKSAKKAAFDQDRGTTGRARYTNGTSDRRTSSVSEGFDRPPSRLTREERRSGLRSPDPYPHGSSTPPPPSSARSENRYSVGSDLAARKERLRSAEVGSEAWMAELESLRHRGARSRASGGSSDFRSVSGDHPPRSPSSLERDRTVRAINALLAGQGIVATAIDPSSPSNASSKKSSPRKSDASIGGYERNRAISFVNGTHQASTNPPGSGTMSRSASTTSSRGGLGSSSRTLASQASAGDHHKLLLSAFDHFERFFSTQDGAENPESAELVKRMSALIVSTTKINNGLRSLTETIQEEQVQAELDEQRRSPNVSIIQFEKNVHALLRSSDDQVRNLSEDLLAFTRVARERERLRKDSAVSSSRPASRAGPFTSGPLQSPPKRAATSSPFDSATVSLSASRSPNLTREVLRNPLEDPNDSVPTRRSTLHFAGRSPFSSLNVDSPSPASRRDIPGSRSPLSTTGNYETPPRRQSISASSTLSSGTAGSGGRPSTGRGKNSDPARSPSYSSTVTFPTSVPTAKVDSTPAMSNTSPTRLAHPIRPLEGQHRTYSGASGDAIAFEALEMAANVDESRARERAMALERLEPARSSPTETRSIISTPPSDLRRPRTRSSMGALGSALKNALTRSKKSDQNIVDRASSPVSTLNYPRGDSSASFIDDRRSDRRKEVEDILRRTTSRT